MKFPARKIRFKNLIFKLKHRLFVLERKWACHPVFGRFYPKKTIYKRTIAVLLALVVISSSVLIFFQPKQTDAAWFDYSYAFRQKITFVHNAALTNAAMRLTISNTNTLVSAGKMQIDCDDSRFTDSNGNLLRYRLVSGCNSASTVYDVVFPTVLNGTNLAFFYYGNASAASLSDSSIPTGTTPSGAPSFAAEEKGPGPVLYLNFDEGQGTVANNSGVGGSALNGTLTNIASPATAASGWNTSGTHNKSLSFDGTNDNILIADNSQLEPSSDMTISFWVKLNRTASAKGSSHMFIYKNNTVSPWFSYQFYQSNTDDALYMEWRNSSGTSFTTYTNSSALAANKWYHIAYIKNGSAGRIYIDGIDRTAYTASHTGTIFNSDSQFTVGGLSAKWTDGAMDEIKLFNYALTADQVKAEINRTASAVMGSSEKAWLTDGLVGYWALDESSGNASDSSGINNALTNNSTTGFTAGKFGNAGSFVAVSTDYFSTAAAINNIQTVSFWTNPTASTDEFINLSAASRITASSGTVFFTGASSPKVFVNGIENGTITANAWNLVTVTSTAAINANAFEIGRANGAYTNGLIDDVRIYNRALSSAEISRLYDWAPDPVGWWKMDENTGTAAYDSSGNNLTGTLTNGPIWTNGKAGTGLSFDGTNDLISVSDSDLLTPPGDMTISFWAKLDQLASTKGEDMDFITKNNSTSTPDWNSYDFVQRASDNKLVFSWINSSAAYFYTVNNTTLSINQWYYITFVKNGTSGKIYINGIDDTATSDTHSGTMLNTDSTLNIGANGASGLRVDGSIDDVRIYDYARSAKQIVSNMNAGHPAVGSPVGSAIAHYKFDEGYGTTANNSGSQGEALNGTLTNMASPATYGSGWTNSGKFGKALSFDNNDDSVIITHAQSQLLTEGFTLSAWVNPSSLGESSFGRIIDKSTGTSGENGYYLYIDTNNKISLRVNAGTLRSSANNSVPLNVWTHVLVTVAPDATVTYFINGNQNGSSGTTGALSGITTTNPLTIGNRSGATDRTFDGKIDEVKIYNYALSSNEVKTEFNQGKSIVLGALATDADGQSTNSAARAYCPPGNTETNCAAGLNPAPVGEWKLDERTGTTAYDTSGNANNATINGASWSTGKKGQALKFNGTSDYTTIPNNSVFDFGAGQNFSVSAWVKTTQPAVLDSWPMIISKDSSVTVREGFNLVLHNSNTDPVWYFEIFVNGTQYRCVGLSDIADGSWHNITAIRSGTSLITYQDGVLANTCAGSSGSVAKATPLNFGLYSQYASYYLNGSIDNVTIYNYVRTPAQVAWDYNRGGPVGHWKFDECQGATAYDSSGNGLNGTINYGASGNTSAGTCSSGVSTEMWNDGTNGKFNSSLGFDGTNDYVQMSDSRALKPTTLTVSAWVKPTNFTCTGADTNCQIFAKYGGDNTGYQLLANSGGVIAGYVYNGAISTNVSSSRPLTSNTWQMVTFTWDGTDAKIYINGLHNNTNTGAITLTHNTTAPTIGKASWYSGNYFNGLIDDVRVYNYPLSPAQIKLLYNENSAIRYGPLTGSP